MSVIWVAYAHRLSPKSFETSKKIAEIANSHRSRKSQRTLTAFDFPVGTVASETGENRPSPSKQSNPVGTNEKPLSLLKDKKNGFQFRSKLSGTTINARPFHHSSSAQPLPARHAQPAGHDPGHLFGNDHCEWHAPANRHGPFPIHGNAPTGRVHRPATHHRVPSRNTGRQRHRQIRHHPRRKCREPSRVLPPPLVPERHTQAAAQHTPPGRNTTRPSGSTTQPDISTPIPPAATDRTHIRKHFHFHCLILFQFSFLSLPTPCLKFPQQDVTGTTLSGRPIRFTEEEHSRPTSFGRPVLKILFPPYLKIILKPQGSVNSNPVCAEETTLVNFVSAPPSSHVRCQICMLTSPPGSKLRHQPVQSSISDRPSPSPPRAAPCPSSRPS